jgi:hypothetical protein
MISSGSVAMSCRFPVFLHEQASERKIPERRHNWVDSKNNQQIML